MRACADHAASAAARAAGLRLQAGARMLQVPHPGVTSAWLSGAIAPAGAHRRHLRAAGPAHNRATDRRTCPGGGRASAARLWPRYQNKMKLLSRLPLRALLTLPYLLLVLGTAIVIGVLSYAAGRDSVDDLSGQLLTETVQRIEQAVEGHVSGSAAVLEVAFPKGIAAPESITGELPALRERFWLATSVHRDPNNYAY